MTILISDLLHLVMETDFPQKVKGHVTYLEYIDCSQERRRYR